MGEGGHRESQGLVEQNLARGGLQQVGSPYNLVDVHERVIHNHGKLIGKDVVRAADDEISYRLLYVLLQRAGQQFGERDDALIIDAKAEGRAAIAGLVFPALLLCQVPARSGVARTLVLFWGTVIFFKMFGAPLTSTFFPSTRISL